MPNKAGGTAFTADLRPALAALGVLSGIAVTVKTNRYTGSVLKYSHTLMAQEFNRNMDLAALTNHKKYHHVYEWDEVGDPEARLWIHTLTGGGASRVASFDFIASKKPVPSAAERKNDPNDPTYLVPQNIIDKLSTRKYFFYWKAPVMEYKTPVTVNRKYSNFLFVPSQHVPWYFSKGPITINNSGGDETTGAFTAFWTAWWAESAQRVFEEQVETTIENDLGKSPIEAAANRYRSRSKTVGLTTIADNDTAFQYGKKLAETFLTKKSAQYEAAKSAILESEL